MFERMPLTLEELEQQQATELPQREAMTIISFGHAPLTRSIDPTPIPPGDALPYQPPADDATPIPPGDALPGEPDLK